MPEWKQTTKKSSQQQPLTNDQPVFLSIETELQKTAFTGITYKTAKALVSEAYDVDKDCFKLGSRDAFELEIENIEGSYSRVCMGRVYVAITTNF